MLCVLCGCCGSGKTTLSRQLAEQYNAKLYCFDNLPNSHHPKYAESVRNKMWQDIAVDLNEGKKIIVDDLHTRLRWRKGLLSYVSDISCQKNLIVMNTPLEECLKRNANRQYKLPEFVVENTFKNYEPPTLDEGWDEIIVINDNEN